MLRRMGYVLEDFNLEEIEKCAVIGSAQELLCKLDKAHFMCMIGPPASGKTLTMFQVDNSIGIARKLLMCCSCTIIQYLYAGSVGLKLCAPYSCLRVHAALFLT